MRKVASYLGFLLPLFICCASFMLLKIATISVDVYEQALSKDYALIIVSSKKLELSDVSSAQASSMNELDTSNMLNKLSGQLSAANIKTLKASLPHFYELHFDSFMSEMQIQAAAARLMKITGIDRVETFSKTHTKVYHLLLLLKGFSFFASFIIALLCWILFAKQTRLWLYEHTERINVLKLLGASFFGRCAFMFKMVFISCVICYFLELLLFINFGSFSFVREFYAQLDAPFPDFEPFSELAIICASAFALSSIAVLIVLKKASK